VAGQQEACTWVFLLELLDCSENGTLNLVPDIQEAHMNLAVGASVEVGLYEPYVLHPVLDVFAASEGYDYLIRLGVVGRETLSADQQALEHGSVPHLGMESAGSTVPSLDGLFAAIARLCHVEVAQRHLLVVADLY